MPISCCNYITEDAYKLVRDDGDDTPGPDDVIGAEQCLRNADSEYTRRAVRTFFQKPSFTPELNNIYSPKN